MEKFEMIPGGVTAALGFTAAGIHCGVKSQNPAKKDVALVVSDQDCAAAAVYTKNQVKAAPLHITREHLKNGRARAIVANSGNANACAPLGEENARRMAAAASKVLDIPAEDIVVASTGVIGQTLNVSVIEQGLPKLAAMRTPMGGVDAAEAIMTTDTVRKEFALKFMIGEDAVTMGGMAKGSGMIHPNMGTMLCFITTDIAISPALLQKALSQVVEISFNCVSVDGDSSTNDMCVVLANGRAGNAEIREEGPEYQLFLEALQTLCVKFAKAIAGDGEGATKLVTCTLSGAQDDAEAKQMAKSVIASSLVKAAMFGADANWGRVLCALGYSGAAFDPDTVSVAFASAAGRIEVCKDGRGLPFDEDLAKKILSVNKVVIDVQLHKGAGKAECWGCDLTYDYVKINGDYRT